MTSPKIGNLAVSKRVGAVMRLDLTDDETRALLNVLVEVIEAGRYPNSPRIRVLRDIPAKFGSLGWL